MRARAVLLVATVALAGCTSARLESYRLEPDPASGALRVVVDCHVKNLGPTAANDYRLFAFWGADLVGTGRIPATYDGGEATVSIAIEGWGPDPDPFGFRVGRLRDHMTVSLVRGEKVIAQKHFPPTTDLLAFFRQMRR